MSAGSGSGFDPKSASYLDSIEVVEVQRGPEPGGIGGAYRAFGETLRGLKTTMARLIERVIKKPLSEMMLFGALADGGSVAVVLEGDELRLRS